MDKNLVRMSSVGGKLAARRPARIPSGSSSSITSTSSTAIATRLSGRRETGASSRGRNGMIGAAMPVGGPSGAPAFASDPIGSSEAVGVGERPVGGPAGGPAFAGDPIGSSEAVVVVGCEANTGGGGLGRLITVVGAEVPVASSSYVSGVLLVHTSVREDLVEPPLSQATPSERCLLPEAPSLEGALGEEGAPRRTPLER